MGLLYSLSPACPQLISDTAQLWLAFLFVLPKNNSSRGEHIMGIDYIASLSEDDYKTFRIIVSTGLPDDYEMWLRVRERGKLRAFKERGVIFDEVEISPIEFGTYCKALKKPDFSVASLDRCASAKVLDPASTICNMPADD
jgi:hypothetical protein